MQSIFLNSVKAHLELEDTNLYDTDIDELIKSQYQLLLNCGVPQESLEVENDDFPIITAYLKASTKLLWIPELPNHTINNLNSIKVQQLSILKGLYYEA